MLLSSESLDFLPLEPDLLLESEHCMKITSVQMQVPMHLFYSALLQRPPLA